MTKLQDWFEANSVVFENDNGKTTAIYIEEAIECVKVWLSGKLIAGSEKANPHNDVILKLLAELKDGEYKL